MHRLLENHILILILLMIFIKIITTKEILRKSVEKINSLTEDINYNLQQYEINSASLIMRNNKINFIHRDLLQFDISLKYVNLENNVIKKFENGTFRNLKSVKVVDISMNKLKDLEIGIFDDLKSLKYLNISYNELTTLDRGIFAKNRQLKMLRLSGNRFNYLPEGLFENNKKLTNVKIGSVKQLSTLPSGLFSYLTKLSIVSFRDCNLKSLPENLFRGSFNLRAICARLNALKSLPLKIFKGLVNLETLDFRDNQIESLPDNIFQSCTSLRKLYLNNNRIFKISRFTFTGLQQLDILHVRNNTVTTIEEEALAPLETVIYINFSHNNITNFTKVSHFFEDECSSLEVLDLSFNKISILLHDWIRTPQIQYLNLSNNVISSLKIDDLDLDHNNDYTIDVSYNKITRIDFHKCEENFPEIPGRNITLIMNDNLLKCDGFLYDLLRYFDGSMMKKVRNKLSIETGPIECSNIDEYRGILLSEINSKDYKFIPSKEEIINYEMCPETCNLRKSHSEKKFIIDCSNRNLTEAPKSLCYSGDKEFDNDLNLTGNMLKNMPNFLQPGYNKVVNLDMSHNQISSIPPGIFLENLFKMLKLDNNQLRTISSEIKRLILSSVCDLLVGNNPWECDCEATNLLDLIQRRIVKDIDNVYCENSKIQVKTTTFQDLCPIKVEAFITLIGILIGVMGLLLGIFILVFHRSRKKIKVWLYSRNLCLWYVTEEELDKDKTYDAFISYSHKDENFVINKIITTLEKDSFKLCVHFRDWPAGGWIPFQIANSIRESRRTIVVVSPNFIESEWGKVEFRAAHKEALSEGRARIIVVVFGDIGPIDKLESDLQSYMKMNTYVQWGDPWFWDKLRYALPHKSDGNFKNKDLKNSDRPLPIAQLDFNKIEKSHYSNMITSPLHEHEKIMQNQLVGIVKDDEPGSSKMITLPLHEQEKILQNQLVGVMKDEPGSSQMITLPLHEREKILQNQLDATIKDEPKSSKMIALPLHEREKILQNQFVGTIKNEPKSSKMIILPLHEREKILQNQLLGIIKNDEPESLKNNS